jgi:hypothetical protein
MKKNIHQPQNTKKTKTRRRRHVRRRKTRQKGGDSNVQNTSTFKTITTALSFGLLSVLIGPIYILAELLSIPITNLNHLTRKSFKENKKAFFHLPFHKLITGCGNTKEMTKKDFILQEDMYIKKNVSVVSCYKNDDEDADTDTNKETIKAHPPSIRDTLMDVIGMIPAKRQFKHQIFSLFQYIDNLRETDEQRKTKIQQLIRHIASYKTLIKCYLISNTIKCTPGTTTKTIIADEDVVNIVSPWTSLPGYDTRVDCMWSHLTKDRFTDEEKEKCRALCNTCTFNNSFRRTTRKYFSFFSGGSTNLTPLLNTYYKYLKIDRKNVPLPSNETDVFTYLDHVKVTTDLNDKLEEEDKKEVLEMFHRFLCKYDILTTLKEQIKIKVKQEIEKGYTMEQVLSFI